MSAASDLEEKLGHVFQNPALLEEALTHASLAAEGADNERLEFLGDRVLGLCIAALLYRAFPHEVEGDLAKRHAALVQRDALAGIAESIGLTNNLKLSATALQDGGKGKSTILADALEAVLGAVYLDGGYAAADSVVHNLWEGLHDKDAAPPEDPKTRLQEWAQGQGLPLPKYEMLSRTGPDHAPLFEVGVTVEGHGGATAFAASKREAEKEAARILLDRLEKTE